VDLHLYPYRMACSLSLCRQPCSIILALSTGIDRADSGNGELPDWGLGVQKNWEYLERAKAQVDAFGMISLFSVLYNA
jgi:hypothetical protein